LIYDKTNKNEQNLNQRKYRNRMKAHNQIHWITLSYANEIQQNARGKDNEPTLLFFLRKNKRIGEKYA
jgi:hypothetical protein